MSGRGGSTSPTYKLRRFMGEKEPHPRSASGSPQADLLLELQLMGRLGTAEGSTMDVAVYTRFL